MEAYSQTENRDNIVFGELQEYIANYAEYAPNWEEDFGENPVFFWSNENYKYLRTISQAQRIFLLARTCREVNFSVNETEKYFECFPEDLRFIADNYGNKFSDFRSTGTEWYLINTVAPQIIEYRKKQSQYYDIPRDFTKPLEIAERRRHAKERLLNPYTGTISYEILTKKLRKMTGFFRTFKEASEISNYSKNTLLDPSDIFDKNFDKLTHEEKALMAQEFLSQIQSALIFDEVFNSCFTAEKVEKESTSTRQSTNAGNLTYNERHSMLYQSYQPSNSYDTRQEMFEREMDSPYYHGGAIDEYPFHRMILEIINKFRTLKEGADVAITTLVDFWDKNRNPIFANVITQALEELDPALASKLLLQKIRETEGNKIPLAAILYRLEFGKMGISKEGVRYLERNYDLREFNNPDYFVNRLTAQGDMGIFDENDELIRYFNLGNIGDVQSATSPQVLEFTYQTLFIPKEGESDAERKERENFCAEFKQKYFNFQKLPVFANSNVSLNNLSFKEQAAFLMYYQYADPKLQKKIDGFVSIHDEDGIKLFLMLNIMDDSFGEKILSSTDGLSEVDAKRVVSRIAHVLSATEEVRVRLQDNNDLSETQRKVLLATQRQVIERAIRNIESLGDETNKNLQISKILSTDVEAVLFTSLLLASKDADINFLLEDLADTQVEHKNPQEISLEDKTAIREMYSQNYTKTPQLRDRLLEGFDTSFLGNGEFVIIKNKEEVVASCYFKEEDGVVYFGKFNVKSTYQGSALGEEIMREELDTRSMHKVIEADVVRDISVASNYIERGFIATSEYPLDETTALKIFRNERLNESIFSKHLSKNDIKKIAKNNEFIAVPESGIIVFSCSQKDFNNTSFKNLIGRSDDEGTMVMTRYIKEKSKAGETMFYFVFEKIDLKKLEKYKTGKPVINETKLMGANVIPAQPPLDPNKQN